MSTLPNDPRRHQQNTYFAEEGVSQEEMKRLSVQDQMCTLTMGGVLPEQVDVTAFGQVLDVGCGTGNWLIAIAKAAPKSRFVGIDANRHFAAYAREQAQREQVSNRVEFHVMDALHMIECPPQSFDLINHRFGLSWLRTWEWAKLLQEYQRVARPGGIVRITEGDTIIQSTSPALVRLNALSLDALHQAGHFFRKQSDGLTSELPDLMARHGLNKVQTRIVTPTYHAGTLQGQLFADDMQILYRIIVPFVRKWARMPDEYEALYQQMLYETHQPDFVAEGRVVTAWGSVSGERCYYGLYR